MFDCLEDKTLLAVTTPVSDVQGLQQHISSDHLVVFLANLAEVLSTRPAVQQFATQVLKTHETGDLQVEMAAMSANVLLPSDISESSDKDAARTVLKDVGTANFDQTLLSTLSQVEQSRATAAQQLVNSTSNTAIQKAVQPEIQDDMQTAQQADALRANLGPTGSLSQGNGPAMPSNDVEYVQTAHSTNVFEILISQAAALTSSRNDVQLYAEKLISDHHQSDMQTSELANYLGINPSPILSPTDLDNARKVLGTLNTANFDQTYLMTNVTAHQMDIQTNQQEIARTKDPNVKQYAMDDIPTDTLHMIGAQTLLNSTSTTATFENSGATNVKIRTRGPRNGRVVYSVTFNDNGFRYNQIYMMNIRRLSRMHNGSFTALDAANLFVQSLNARIQQLQSSGTTSLAGLKVISHATPQRNG